MNAKVCVIVTFQFEGIHCWPGCNVSGVEFLENPHRHIFHVRAEKVVAHNDRDVEIIDLKRRMAHFMGPQDTFAVDLGSRSCEDIALELLQAFECESVEVTEDGENGAIARKL